MSPALLLAFDPDENHLERIAAAWPGLRTGMRLVTATSAEEALGVAERRYCDVVAAEQGRRGSEGIEMLEQIQQMCPATRLILTPRRVTTRLLLEASRLQVHRVLAKPFTARQLADVARLA